MKLLKIFSLKLNSRYNFIAKRLQNNFYLIKLNKTLIEFLHVGLQNVDSVFDYKISCLDRLN